MDKFYQESRNEVSVMGTRADDVITLMAKYKNALACAHMLAINIKNENVGVVVSTLLHDFEEAEKDVFDTIKKIKEQNMGL
jgi:hypothetical protein